MAAPATAASAVTPFLTGVQKSAILLVALGDQGSAEVLKHLSEEEVQLVSNAIADLPPISPEHLEIVLEEFQALTANAAQAIHGGVAFAKRILTSAFGPEGKQETPGAPSRSSGQELTFARATAGGTTTFGAICTQRTSPDGPRAHLGPPESGTVSGRSDFPRLAPCKRILPSVSPNWKRSRRRSSARFRPSSARN